MWNLWPPAWSLTRTRVCYAIWGYSCCCVVLALDNAACSPRPTFPCGHPFRRRRSPGGHGLSLGQVISTCVEGPPFARHRLAGRTWQKPGNSGMTAQDQGRSPARTKKAVRPAVWDPRHRPGSGRGGKVYAGTPEALASHTLTHSAHSPTRWLRCCRIGSGRGPAASRVSTAAG